MQFNLFKTRVNITFLFWAVVTFMLLVDRSNTAIITLISAVLHESGHLIVMYIFKSPPENLTLGIFGMRIDKKESTLSFSKEAIVAFAGPFVNLIIFSISLLVYKFNKSESALKWAVINLCMGMFNLIPIEPLDGGRAIKNALSTKFNEQRIDEILNIFLYVFLSLLFILSFAIIYYSGYNFTLLIFCVYISLLLIFKRR